MPKQDHSLGWESTFRKQVRTTIKGWTVRKSIRNKIQIEVRKPKYQSVSLSYTWHEYNTGDAYIRIRNIYNLTLDGHDLKTATNIAENNQEKSTLDLDWHKCVYDFRLTLTNVGNVTWTNKYKPVLDYALHFLTETRQANNAADLSDLVLRKWIGKTEQHAICRRALWRFLKYCVNRKGFNKNWLPPTEIPSSGKRKQKKIGYPISDAQFLSLIESLKDERWIFAFQLCCVYGLRPEELRYLHIRNNNELWSGYTKSKGGTKGDTTNPRQLFPVLVKHIDTTPIDWNLLDRIKINEQLPPLGNPGKAGQSLRKYLRNKPIWQSLRKQAQLEGQSLVPYSFRHRYSKQLHGTHLRPKQIADAMGHDLKTHLLHYARFISDDLTKEFDKINA